MQTCPPLSTQHSLLGPVISDMNEKILQIMKTLGMGKINQTALTHPQGFISTQRGFQNGIKLRKIEEFFKKMKPKKPVFLIKQQE